MKFLNSTLVSVIIPVYNSSNVIKRCISSIINQTYRNLEIIVIDDGSTDDSLLKLAYIKDPRLHVFKEKHLGVSHARNLGLSKCSGDYVMFVDSDDVIDQNALSLLVEFVTSNKDIDVVKFGYNIVKNDRHVTRKIPIELCNRMFDTRFENDREQLIDCFFRDKNTIPCYSCTLFCKKEFFKRSNLSFREDLYMMEDAVFHLDLIHSDGIFSFLADAIYDCYYNSESVTRSLWDCIRISRGALESAVIILNRLDYPGIAAGKYFKTIFRYVAKDIYVKGKIDGILFDTDLKKIALAASFTDNKLFWDYIRKFVLKKDYFMICLLGKMCIYPSMIRRKIGRWMGKIRVWGSM